MPINGVNVCLSWLSEPTFAPPNQDFDAAVLLREDCTIESNFKGRLGLPADSNLHPSRRDDCEFFVATEPHIHCTSFSQKFADAVPLKPWPYETNCDLCNHECSAKLYHLRCAKRDSNPLRFEKDLIYAGAECTKALLRQEKTFQPKLKVGRPIEA